MLAERLRRLTPYVAGEQPQDRRYIKLNTNENPYPPTPRIAEFLRTADLDLLRRYPDPQSLALRQAVARHYDLDATEVFAGNGSDEVLSLAFFAFFDSSRGPLLFPEHTYSFYPVYCDFYNIAFTRLPLDRAWQVRVEDYTASAPACGAILANPNAPTGIALPLADIQRLLERFASDRVVVIDEAYVDFGGQSAVPLIRRHPNLLVCMTFSKSWALAGLRLGCAMGNPALIQALTNAKDAFNSYPVDALAQRIGVIALQEADYQRSMVRRIVTTREAFRARAAGLGWELLPSAANFLFARHPLLQGSEVYRRLKQRGILVRHFDRDGIRDFVRITVGTDEQMARLLEEMPRLAPDASAKATTPPRSPAG
jgi:histidinol-phosphate aminotransferase